MPEAAAATTSLDVHIRPLVEDDQRFVFGTWLNHAKSSSRYGRSLDRDVYFKSFHRTIEALLRRPSCRTLVATTFAGSEEIILGYLVTDEIGSKPAVHFAFVKNFCRGKGVFRALWQASGIDGDACLWSCPTDAEPWVKRRFPQIEVLDLFR